MSKMPELVSFWTKFLKNMFQILALSKITILRDFIIKGLNTL